MPREVTFTAEPQELRCPVCGVLVGHSVIVQEAAPCSDCRRLAPVLERLTAIEHELREMGLLRQVTR